MFRLRYCFYSGSTRVADAPQVPAGRRVQNRQIVSSRLINWLIYVFRAAQRAFRERKQSQLADLQARVQSYEQGEIERSVALQAAAKRLKEENDCLHQENKLLRDRILELESASQLQKVQDDKKRPREEPLDDVEHAFPKKVRLYNASPKIAIEGSCAATPLLTPAGSTTSDLSRLLELPDREKSSLESSGILYCGLCSDNTPCVCRELILHTKNSRIQPTMNEEYPQRTGPMSSFELKSDSILYNLPPYQAPVPLRKRIHPKGKSVFPIHKDERSDKPANCSGDPDNCMACANDSFGKEFCTTLNKAHTPCDDCPSENVDIDVQGEASRSDVFSHPGVDSETIPTNTAWQQLKAHPNVAFADLSLLADVVARRSKCTGPRILLSPGPDDSRRHGGREDTPPQLVPQELLVQCGQQRMRQVQAAGVRDALRLLDAQFPRS